MKKVLLFIVCLSLTGGFLSAQEITVARIHYGGGGDWYGNKTTWPNIFKRVYRETGIKTATREVSVRILEGELLKYPIAYIAGHGNIFFSEQEAAALRRYLISGGFLYADDDYGMDRSFRREMKKVFPELKFVELPFNHPIYHIFYDFPRGLPKVHKHHGGPPRGYGLFYKGRLVCFYSYNTDISDGCEDESIHHDPPQIRELALRMAVNILLYALLN